MDGLCNSRHAVRRRNRRAGEVWSSNISADAGLGIRTLVIFVIIAVINVVVEKYNRFGLKVTSMMSFVPIFDPCYERS